MSYQNLAIDLKSFVPITRFNKCEAGKIIDEVAQSGIKVLMKNNMPAAVMLSPEKYQEMLEQIEDAQDYALAISREKSGNNNDTISFEDVLKQEDISTQEK